MLFRILLSTLEQMPYDIWLSSAEDLFWEFSGWILKTYHIVCCSYMLRLNSKAVNFSIQYPMELSYIQLVYMLQYTFKCTLNTFCPWSGYFLIILILQPCSVLSLKYSTCPILRHLCFIRAPILIEQSGRHIYYFWQFVILLSFSKWI